MLRVRTILSGWSAGPGLSTFYFEGDMTASDPDACVARVQSFWSVAAGIMNNATKINVQSLVDVIDDQGEVLATQQAATSVPQISGGQSNGGLAAPSLQLLLQLKTATFNSGRRLQGRTFIGPLSGAGQDADGTPSDGQIALILPALVTLTGVGTAGPKQVVWRRPRPVKPPTKPATFDRAGSHGVVTSVAIPNKFATLRSRRD